ncbi:hypothetical protein BKA69DRAFT_1041955 [Paraphysoderma sedebokerense]|nr:hypothetical protein BKA69DRAFT_1041955 [Paraphysoderma sedebokerense]
MTYVWDHLPTNRESVMSMISNYSEATTPQSINPYNLDSLNFDSIYSDKQLAVPSSNKKERRHSFLKKSTKSKKKVAHVPRQMYTGHKKRLSFSMTQGAKEALKICRGYLKEGCRFNGLFDVAVSMQLYIKYQKDRRLGIPNPETAVRHMDLDRITYLHDIFQFSVASFGWLGLVFLGFGNGIQRFSNFKVMLKHLNIEERDVLMYEGSEYFIRNGRKSKIAGRKVDVLYSTSDELLANFQVGSTAKPCFYVVNYKPMDSIIFCVRGTLNIEDILTDIICHYVPFQDGFAHQGFLLSANRIYNYTLTNIKNYISTHHPRKLIFTGHSMGASVSVLLYMLFEPHLEEFKRLSGHGDNFKMRAIAYATPADSITTVVMHRDNVVKACYGNAADMKALLSKTSALKGRGFKNKFGILSEQDRRRLFSQLDQFRSELRAEGKNIKLYVPGRIYQLVRHKKQKTPYRVTQFKSKSKASDYAIGATINKNSRLITLTDGQKRVVELCKVSPDDFTELTMNFCSWKHHLPNYYDNGLARAKLWAIEGMNRGGRKKSYK